MLQFPRTRFLRPGPLDGNRREYRAGERWMLPLLRGLAPLLPPSARPIHASIVARAAVRAALDPAPGAVRYDGAALFRSGREPG